MMNFPKQHEDLNELKALMIKMTPLIRICKRYLQTFDTVPPHQLFTLHSGILIEKNQFLRKN